jgi:hypothetical protein
LQAIVRALHSHSSGCAEAAKCALYIFHNRARTRYPEFRRSRFLYFHWCSRSGLQSDDRRPAEAGWHALDCAWRKRRHRGAASNSADVTRTSGSPPGPGCRVIPQIRRAPLERNALPRNFCSCNAALPHWRTTLGAAEAITGPVANRRSGRKTRCVDLAWTIVGVSSATRTRSDRADHFRVTSTRIPAQTSFAEVNAKTAVFVVLRNILTSFAVYAAGSLHWASTGEEI